MHRALLLATLLLATILAGCGTDEIDEGIYLQVDERTRRYELYRPANLAPDEPASLLIMLHGALGDGPAFRGWAQMEPLADQADMLIAWADGTTTGLGPERLVWNAAHCCGLAHRNKVNDVAFIEAIIDDVDTNHHPVKARQVFLGGHSNGAMLAHRAAAQLSDKIAAIGAVSGTLGGNSAPNADTITVPPAGGPVSVLVIHARDDPNVPYKGGVGEGFFGLERRYDLSVAETVGYWLNVTGASREPETEGPTAGITRIKYPGGREGTDVQIISTFGGHGWPGGGSNSFSNSPRSPSASFELINFFLAHPKQGAIAD